jgi:hypothetical protein
MRQIDAPNFGNGTMEATLEDFEDLVEEGDISYEYTAEVG